VSPPPEELPDAPPEPEPEELGDDVPEDDEDEVELEEPVPPEPAAGLVFDSPLLESGFFELL
jgi:hypothetical protein